MDITINIQFFIVLQVFHTGQSHLNNIRKKVCLIFNFPAIHAEFNGIFAESVTINKVPLPLYQSYQDTGNRIVLDQQSQINNQERGHQQRHQ